MWSCEFGGGADLTVGAKFKLSCHGDIAVAWSGEPVHVAFAQPQDAYALVVLKSERLDPNAADFTVTAYKPGAHTPEYIRILQGDKGFEVDHPKWEVKSVLDPKQQAKPYGPYGPFHISLPLWILIAAGVIAALLVLAIYRFARRRVQRRRMLDELKRHRTALSPLHQFYRDARHLRRRLHAAKTEEELKTIGQDLNREFRLYVLRRFEVPALEWTDAEILGDLRRRHRRVVVRAGDPLKRTLRELLRLQSRPRLLLEDVEQMHHMSLDAAEKLEDAVGGTPA